MNTIEEGTRNNDSQSSANEHIDKNTGEISIVSAKTDMRQAGINTPITSAPSIVQVETFPSNDIPPEMDEPPQSIEDYPPEPEDEVTPQNFVARLKIDMQKKRITPEYAKSEGNNIKVKYPSTFRSYTDSPSELLNDLRLLGQVIEEGAVKGISSDRIIILKG